MSVDEDRSPRAVGVRTPEGDFDWTLEPARDGNGLWTIVLRSPDRTWRGTGHNCFAALRNLRSALDSDGILIGVNGARRNALVSGMQADMGEGRVMYLAVLGQTDRPEQVRTLDPAHLNEVATVVTQDDFKNEWLRQRRSP